MDVPSGPPFAAAVGPAVELYQAGDTEGATDAFLRVAIGPAYRGFLDRLFPGAYAQMVADADTFFAAELAMLRPGQFTREDARRITQPVLAVLGSESARDWAGWPEVHARVQAWLPQAEPFVLAGANHALEEMDPRGSPRPWPRSSPTTPSRRRPERAELRAAGAARAAGSGQTRPVARRRSPTGPGPVGERPARARAKHRTRRTLLIIRSLYPPAGRGGVG